MKNMIICTAEAVKVENVPSEVKILPLGKVHSQKGNFVVDDESFLKMKEQFEQRKLDLVIDYEHQTLKDIEAPAGGWIKELIKGEDAVIAKVEWTAKAKEYLKNKEYRYLSPVVLTRKIDNKAIMLHSVALTNTPAIDGMYAIVNSLDIEREEVEENGGNKKMNKLEDLDLKKIIEALKIDNADEEEIIKAVAKLVSSVDTDEDDIETEVVANSIVLSLLDLDKNAKTEDVTAKILSFKNNTDTKALLELKAKFEEREAEEIVMTALKDGKITAAQKEWAKAYALKNIKGFKQFMEKASVVVPVGKITDKEDKKQNSNVEVDMKILKNMGLSKEDIEKYGKAEDENE